MRTQFLILMTLIFITGAVHGATGPSRKTDVIVLYNGDRVTGEIESLFAGLLEVDTSSMGTIKIEWQDIAKISSQYHYEVRLAEGKRYYGKVTESSRPGELKVSDVYGEYQISTLEVVEMRPVANTFADSIDLYLSVGMSYTKASSLGQTNLNTDISYETEQTRNSLSGRVNITDSEEVVTRSSKLDLARSVWTDRQDTYRILLGSYESNDELALDYRVSLGAGLGRYFTDTQASSWTGSVALQVLTEQSTLGDTQESVEGVLNTQYSAWKYDTPKLNLKLNLTVFPSVTESGRVRANSDLNLRWEIIKDLYWDVTAFGTYDNKAADDSRFDYGITTGIGWEY